VADPCGTLIEGIPVADSDSKDKPKRSQSPTAKRQAKRREERLELIRQQVEEGTLTIRQMTPEERKKNPPQPRKKRK
jgi:hypothetical protein